MQRKSTFRQIAAPAPEFGNRLGARLGRRSLLAGLAALGAGPLLPRLAFAEAEAAGGDLIGRMRALVTGADTILLDVARSYDLGIIEISAANPGVDPWVPGEERLIVLPTQHVLPDAQRRGIVINLAELRLYFFPPEGPPETHAIGIGRQGVETPLGNTKIVRKKKNPAWYPTAATRRDNPALPKVVGPGPDNPLGTRALYLGWPTYLIHGTSKPYGVGRRVSRGCIRLYPEQIEDLFDKVPIGTPVTVLAQTIKAGWHEGELYLEAHPDSDQLEELEATYRMTLKPPPPVRDYVREKAGDAADRVDWDFVDAELIARRGYPVRITRAVGRERLALRETAAAGETGARRLSAFDLY